MSKSNVLFCLSLQNTTVNLCGCMHDVSKELSSAGKRHDVSELLESLLVLQGCQTGNVLYTKALEDCVTAVLELQA